MSGLEPGQRIDALLPERQEEVNLQPFKSQERQAKALERIADTLDRMLAVMLDEGEPEAVDPGATLDDPSDPRDLPLPFDQDEHPHL
jgi:hypothetical protein